MLRYPAARPDDTSISIPRALPPLPGLPRRLADLTDEAKRALGPALDRQLVQLVLDDDGSPVVARRSCRP